MLTFFSVLCFAVNGKQEFNDSFEELITKLASHSVESEDTQSILRTAQGYICLCRNELQDAKNLLNFRKLGFAVTVNPQNLESKVISDYRNLKVNFLVPENLL